MTPPPRPGSLNRAEISRAALALVDRVGVEHFTMRALATELGLTTMAVYHHFDNKAEVLQAAADQVWLEAASMITPHDDPIEDIVAGFIAVRRAFQAHAEITPYGFGSPTTEGAVHLLALGVVERFERAGFRGARIAEVYHAVATYTFGSALLHAVRITRDRAVPNPVSDIGQGPDLASVPPGSAGAYAAVRDAMRSDPELVLFERGLRDILAGFVACDLAAAPAHEESRTG